MNYDRRTETPEEKCPGDEHDPDENRVCRRCGWSVCLGCEHAFDWMCDLCDEVEPESTP